MKLLLSFLTYTITLINNPLQWFSKILIIACRSEEKLISVRDNEAKHVTAMDKSIKDLLTFPTDLQAIRYNNNAITLNIHS